MIDLLRRVFSTSGRVSRLGFWRFQVAQALAGAVLWCLTMFATMAGGWLGLAPLLLIGPVLAAATYMAIRRLHDRGRSGWWMLPFCLGPYLLMGAAHMLASLLGTLGALLALPIFLAGLALQAWAWIELGFRRGTPGVNRFGPPPTSNRAWLARRKDAAQPAP
ncbi:hypothetical protein ASD89_18445 [Caulobacter sp. Root656]|nr:hypothetical protein ASD89_18445 [Caulobacter sp. Root656]